MGLKDIVSRGLASYARLIGRTAKKERVVILGSGTYLLGFSNSPYDQRY